jgi:hypothetical protein
MAIDWADAGAAPDPALVAATLGPGAIHWHALVDHVTAMGARTAWEWDGPRYGWRLKATRAGRPFLSLTSRDGGCRALVILGRAQVAEVEGMVLGENARAVFDSARQYPDGRWLFIGVTSDRDVADVVAILATKLPPTVRARLAARA